MKQEFLTLHEHPSSPIVLAEFVLPNRIFVFYFCMACCISLLVLFALAILIVFSLGTIIIVSRYHWYHSFLDAIINVCLLIVSYDGHV